VRKACLAEAMTIEHHVMERSGMFGGCSPKERDAYLALRTRTISKRSMTTSPPSAASRNWAAPGRIVTSDR
jgi:hypothetical protein